MRAMKKCLLKASTIAVLCLLFSTLIVRLVPLKVTIAVLEAGHCHIVRCQAGLDLPARVRVVLASLARSLNHLIGQ